jgi:hypothetical protein
MACDAGCELDIDVDDAGTEAGASTSADLVTGHTDTIDVLHNVSVAKSMAIDRLPRL